MDSIDGGIWLEQLTKSGVGDFNKCGPGGRLSVATEPALKKGLPPITLEGLSANDPRLRLKPKPKQAIPLIVPAVAASAAAYLFFPRMLK